MFSCLHLNKKSQFQHNHTLISQASSRYRFLNKRKKYESSIRSQVAVFNVIAKMSCQRVSEFSISRCTEKLRKFQNNKVKIPISVAGTRIKYSSKYSELGQMISQPRLNRQCSLTEMQVTCKQKHLQLNPAGFIHEGNSLSNGK